jgi:lipopolysaccharide transport system permease protein
MKMDGSGNPIRMVLDDWRRALLFWEFWWRFGLLDVFLKYRRTYLGPIWMTLTFAVTAAGLGFVYSQLLNVTSREYIAYLLCGLSVWMYISGMIVEGCMMLIRNAGLIREQNLPIFSHSLRAVLSSFIILLHNFVVVVAAALIFAGPVSPVMLLAIPGLILVTLNGLWLVQFFALICARFRDLPPLITTLVNLSFLVTPIFWYREMLRDRAVLADLNPFYHLIELVRAPLLGEVPAMETYLFGLCACVVGFGITILVASRLQPKMVFWV